MAGTPPLVEVRAGCFAGLRSALGILSLAEFARLGALGLRYLPLVLRRGNADRCLAHGTRGDTSVLPNLGLPNEEVIQGNRVQYGFSRVCQRPILVVSPGRDLDCCRSGSAGVAGGPSPGDRATSPRRSWSAGRSIPTASRPSLGRASLPPPFLLQPARCRITFTPNLAFSARRCGTTRGA